MSSVSFRVSQAFTWAWVKAVVANGGSTSQMKGSIEVPKLGSRHHNVVSQRRVTTSQMTDAVPILEGSILIYSQSYLIIFTDNIHHIQSIWSEILKHLM